MRPCVCYGSTAAKCLIASGNGMQAPSLISIAPVQHLDQHDGLDVKPFGIKVGLQPAPTGATASSAKMP